MAPPPVLPHGYATLYKRPEKVVRDEVLIEELNPYDINQQMKIFMHKILQ
jgi:hypothetical protein